MCLVGDRILTDIVMGNYYGMVTVQVQPFTGDGENMVVKVMRRFENNPGL